jgi:hypothetical protein
MGTSSTSPTSLEKSLVFSTLRAVRVVLLTRMVSSAIRHDCGMSTLDSDSSFKEVDFYKPHNREPVGE